MAPRPVTASRLVASAGRSDAGADDISRSSSSLVTTDGFAPTPTVNSLALASLLHNEPSINPHKDFPMQTISSLDLTHVIGGQGTGRLFSDDLPDLPKPGNTGITGGIKGVPNNRVPRTKVPADTGSIPGINTQVPF